jgi:hypothetical protein
MIPELETLRQRIINVRPVWATQKETCLNQLSKIKKILL